MSDNGYNLLLTGIKFKRDMYKRLLDNSKGNDEVIRYILIELEYIIDVANKIEQFEIEEMARSEGL